MKCSRVALALVLIIFGGITVARGTTRDYPDYETDPCPMTPAESCLDEDLGPNSAANADQYEQADHFDRGDVAAAVEENSQEPLSDSDAESASRYEYPEEVYGHYQYHYGRGGEWADLAEQHYYKYGYRYVDPEQKYGYAEPPAQQSQATAEIDAMNDDSADAETGIPTENLAPPEEDATEPLDDMPKAPTQDADSWQDPEEQAAADLETAASEADEDFELEFAAAEEALAEEIAEAEELAALARAEKAAEAKKPEAPASAVAKAAEVKKPEAPAPAVAPQPSVSTEPYEFDGYYPQYGFEYGQWKSRYLAGIPEMDAAAEPQPEPAFAEQAEATKSDSESKSVEERYGYPEYMGEDYLSEVQGTARDEARDENGQFHPEYSEPVVPDEQRALMDDGSSPTNDDGRETVTEQDDECESDDQASASMDQPDGQPLQAMESQPAESGLELFAYRPEELLTCSDQDLLRTLAMLCEEPSGVRRATLNDYLETLGMDGVDFASRFEETTGIETLGLADDLPGAAAFLGCFRLMEQGELGIEESVDLLRRSVQQFTRSWIDGVGEITTNAYESADQAVHAEDAMPAEEPRAQEVDTRVVEALWGLAVQSLQEIGDLAEDISDRVSQLSWADLLPRIGRDRSASRVDDAVGKF